MRDLFPQELIIPKTSTQSTQGMNLNNRRWTLGDLIVTAKKFPSALKETWENRTWMPAGLNKILPKADFPTDQEAIKYGELMQKQRAGIQLTPQEREE